MDAKEEVLGHLPQYVMVFDVESVGLHGEGFAVGKESNRE